MCGEVQAAQAPASTRHSNVEPAWVDVKANSGVAVSIVSACVIVVSGGVTSITKLCVAGLGSTLPAWSVASAGRRAPTR